MEHSIFAQIRKESSDFFDQSISPVPGYSFNQYDTVKRCHLYHSSKFEDASDYLGREKLFFNVVNAPCEVATKQLNVDTKHIRLWPDNPKSEFATFLLEKELKLWLKTAEMGRILNRVAEELPVYGSVVLEKTPKGAALVDIRRLVNDPSAESITASRFVTTVHYMSPTELRATSWDPDAVETAIERFGSPEADQPWEDDRGDLNQQSSTPLVKVHKRYGEVPRWWVDEKARPGTRCGDEAVRALFIVAGADVSFVNKETKAKTGDAGVVLFKSTWRGDWPYRDAHYTRQKGRWLGVGVVEMLFDVQVRMNELKNQRRVSMELSTIHLFTTPDKQIVRNVLTDLQSGDVMHSPSGIQPLATEERNLAAFDQEETAWATQADKLSFAYEAVRGEAPASSTPLGTTQIVTAQATSVFAFKRENLCLFLREFFNELVTPQLLKDLSPAHVARFVGSAAELQRLDEAAAEVAANDAVKESAIRRGRVPSPEEVEAFKRTFLGNQRRLGEARFVSVKDAFYDDVQFEYDFIIDNEQADPQLIANNLQKVLGDLAANPALLEDPRLRLLYFKFAERLGVPAAELDMADREAQRLRAQQPQLATGQPQPGQPAPQAPNPQAV